MDEIRRSSEVQSVTGTIRVGISSSAERDSWYQFGTNASSLRGEAGEEIGR